VTTVSAGADAQPVSAGSDRLPDMEFAEFFRAEHKKLIAGRHDQTYPICFPAKTATSVPACSLTSYRVAAGSPTCGLVSISATGNVCAG
jgi:hypothetical protein